MTTHPAPLLTQDEWKHVHDCWPTLDKFDDAIQALATGRTRCIQPLSEEEHRAEFNKMYDGFRLLPSSANYRENCFLVWLACARVNGLVK